MQNKTGEKSPKPVKTEEPKFVTGIFISVNLITESVESFITDYLRFRRQYL
jgi:hypothetical protein